MTDSNVLITGGAYLATSLSLLDRARTNDRAAWDRIVYLYSPLVYGWCRQWGLQAADRLDVSQEVLRSVFMRLSDFRKDRPGDSFHKWLKTITRTKTIDFMRQTGRQPQALGVLGPKHRAAALLGGEELSEDLSEQKFLLRRALDLVKAEFEPQTWDAFWGVTIDEKPPTDVAQALGVSVNVVYLSRSRVLHRLASQYSALIDD